MYYTYMLECSDGTLYTGWTKDLTRRLQEHNQGKGSKYTRARRPVSLIYWEYFDNKSEAMKREYQIKQMSRADKLTIAVSNISSGLNYKGDRL